MNNSKPELIAQLAIFAFGILTLVFLVAIDRQQWFELRPVSGAARAMSLGAEHPSIVKGSVPQGG